MTRLLEGRPRLANRLQRGRGLPAIVAVATIGAASLAGCGSASRVASTAASARQAVEGALSALGRQSDLGMRISFGSAQTILVGLETGKGEPLDSPQAVTDAADSLEVSLQSGSITAAEVRFVGGALYMRLDVAKMPGGSEGLATRLGQLNGYVPGLSALASGRWVEASATSIRQLFSAVEQFASQMGVTPPPIAGAVDTIITQVYSDLVAAVEANSAYHDLGSAAGRTGYSLRIDVRGFLDQLGPKLRSDLAALPFGLGSRVGKAISAAAAKVPAGQTATVDIYLAGGAVKEIDAGNVRAVLSAPSPVVAPSGAIQLDLSKLPAVLRQLGGSRAATGGAF